MKNLKTAVLIFTITALASCGNSESPSTCLPYEGIVIYDPLCWGIIIQVKNTKVSDVKFSQDGIEYDNVIQIMGIDSSYLINSKAIDSLYHTDLYKRKSFFFNYRDFKQSDEYLQPPCTANVTWYSLDKKGIITAISETKCFTKQD